MFLNSFSSLTEIIQCPVSSCYSNTFLIYRFSVRPQSSEYLSSPPRLYLSVSVSTWTLSFLPPFAVLTTSQGTYRACSNYQTIPLRCDMASTPQPTAANSRTFPKSTSSPTISSSSQTDSVSTWSSFSATTSHSSPTPPPPPPPPTATGTNGKKIKQFGEGWLTDPSSQPSDFLPNPFASPLGRRARSPSVPNLPSQLQPSPKRFDDNLSSLLDRMELASHTPYAPALSSHPSFGNLMQAHSYVPYQLRAHPNKTSTESRRYPSADDVGHKCHLPTLVESSPILSHHQSVPNFSTSPRLRHSGQVRFPDELDRGDDDYGHVKVMGYGGRKLTSKSMSELSDLSKGNNGEWRFSPFLFHVPSSHLNVSFMDAW